MKIWGDFSNCDSLNLGQTQKHNCFTSTRFRNKTAVGDQYMFHVLWHMFVSFVIGPWPLDIFQCGDRLYTLTAISDTSDSDV